MKKFLLLGLIAIAFVVISCSEPADPNASAGGDTANKMVKITFIQNIMSGRAANTGATANSTTNNLGI